MNPVGHVGHGHLRKRAAREERREELAAYLTVEPAHSIDPGASPHREEGEIEEISSGIPSQLEQFGQGQAGRFRERTGISLHQGRFEPVEGRRHRSVGREHVSSPGCPEGGGKRQLLPGGMGSGASHHCEGGMTFVQIRWSPARMPNPPE